MKLPLRQSQVADLLVQGHQNKQIAHALGLSERTVKTHIQILFRKTGAHSRAHFAYLLNRRAAPQPTENQQ